MIFFVFEETYLPSLLVSHVGLWVRFLDDILCIWKDTQESLTQFTSWLNLQDPKLQFTMICSSQIYFLDVQIVYENDILHTYVYKKPVDHNQLFHFESHHPFKLKQVLPISQFLRIRHICSSDKDIVHQVKTLKNKLYDCR